jgi:hypothetical protein
MKKTFALLAVLLLLSATPKGIERPLKQFEFKNYATPTVEAYDSLATSFEGLLDKLDQTP